MYRSVVPQHPSLKSVNNIDCSPGTNKYVYLALTLGDDGEEYYFVHSSPAEFHKEVIAPLKNQLRQIFGETANIEIIGGGWMDCDPDTETIHIYGRSERYGPAPHEQVCEFMKSIEPKWLITYDSYNLQ